jgi:limonene-1,2-epoxide hydrolase
MKVNRETLGDDADGALDRAIRAVLAQPSPQDVRNRVIEAAVALGSGRSGPRSTGPMPGEMANQAEGSTERTKNHFLERMQNMILAHKRLSVVAAAMLTALAAGVMLYVSLFSSPTTAYAMEQTAQANQYITSYHIKITPPPKDSLNELWIQFNPQGVPFRARIDYLNSSEGPYICVLSEGKCVTWFKAKNSCLLMPVGDLLKQIAQQREAYDPKLAFEKLQSQKKAGRVQIDTKEPAKPGEPITLTITHPNMPDRREVYEVDPKTKLVGRLLTYHRRGGLWESAEQRLYLDYNKAIAPEIFELNLPKDIMTADQFHQQVGLPKGKLSDKQIAVEVVRQYWQAMIAKDYAKASRMYSGITAEKLQSDGVNWLRIVSLGEAKLHSEFHVLRVPVKVEVETPDAPFPHSAMLSFRGTDPKAARAAVRAFCEALAVQDYDRAARIAATRGVIDKTLPVAEMKHLDKALAKWDFKLVGILEIGTPAPAAEKGVLDVPLRLNLKWAKPGKQIIDFSPMVQPALGQRDRWTICGGI